VADLNESDSAVYGELWVSLASLLRSYTALHGLNGKRQATVEWDEERILVRYGGSWLDLRREGARVCWRREDGRSGMLELTVAGQLRSDEGSGDKGSGEEVEIDMAAEAWARDLMRELQR
jgi:hypothetical protein